MRGRLVLRQVQEVLGAGQALLIVFRKVAAAPANRLGFCDLERADVLVDGIAVFQLRAPIAGDARMYAVVVRRRARLPDR